MVIEILNISMGLQLLEEIKISMTYYKMKMGCGLMMSVNWRRLLQIIKNQFFMMMSKSSLFSDRCIFQNGS